MTSPHAHQPATMTAAKGVLVTKSSGVYSHKYNRGFFSLKNFDTN
jgi:hypothetical protein